MSASDESGGAAVRFQSTQREAEVDLLLTTSERESLLQAIAEIECDHPWHDNPALLTECPNCGAGGEETDDGKDPHTKTSS